jgi:hypothetical protein
MDAQPKSSQALHPAKVILMGLLCAVVSSTIIFFVTSALFQTWYTKLPFKPDFGTNGVLWILIGIGMFDEYAVPFLLLILFCIVLPLSYSRSRKQLPSQLDTKRIVGITLLAEFVVSALVMWGTPLIVAAIVIGPILAVTVAAAILFLKWLNASLYAIHVDELGKQKLLHS